jgi:hypothetical protein
MWIKPSFVAAADGLGAEIASRGKRMPGRAGKSIQSPQNPIHALRESIQCGGSPI